MSLLQLQHVPSGMVGLSDGMVSMSVLHYPPTGSHASTRSYWWWFVMDSFLQVLWLRSLETSIYVQHSLIT